MGYFQFLGKCPFPQTSKRLKFPVITANEPCISLGFSDHVVQARGAGYGMCFCNVYNCGEIGGISIRVPACCPPVRPSDGAPVSPVLKSDCRTVSRYRKANSTPSLPEKNCCLLFPLMDTTFLQIRKDYLKQRQIQSYLSNQN